MKKAAQKEKMEMRAISKRRSVIWY